MKWQFHLFRQISPLTSLPKPADREGGLWCFSTVYLQAFSQAPHHHQNPHLHPLGSPRLGLKSMRLKTKPEDLILYTQSPDSKCWQRFSTNPWGTQRASLPLVSCCKENHCKASASFPIKSHQGHTFQLAVSAYHPEAAQVQDVFPPPGFRAPPNTSHLPVVNLSRAMTLPALGLRRGTGLHFCLIYSCEALSEKAGLHWHRGNAEKTVRPGYKCVCTAYFLKFQEGKFFHSGSKHCAMNSPKESQIWIPCKKNLCHIPSLAWDYKQGDKQTK